MPSTQRLLILTDLDATLLDQRYSFDAAMPAIERLRRTNTPLVINSSKTRAEIELMTELVSLSGVFISENGGAVFIDRDFPLPSSFDAKPYGAFNAVILGRPYGEVLHALKRAKDFCSLKARGFSDMSIEEIASLTGLDMESAARARIREFSEAFIPDETGSCLECLRASLERDGMSYVPGGEFSYAQGPTDKGKAALLVRDLFLTAYPDISWKTVALGDGPNDIPALMIADVAVVIRKSDRSLLDYRPPVSQRVLRPSAIGPEGWNEAISSLM